jgi:hypothetical protein
VFYYESAIKLKKEVSMADQGLASPNMDEAMKKEIQSEGGKASRSGRAKRGGSTTSGRGSKEGQIKGGKHSHDNQYT